MENQPAQTTTIVDQQQAAPKLGMFERRMSRIGFLSGLLYLYVIIFMPLLFQLAVRGHAASSNSLATTTNILSILFGVAMLLVIFPILFSLYIRRLHDLNRPGILSLIMLVPVVNFFFWIYMLAAPGTQGVNQYGSPINSFNIWVVLGFKKPIYTN